MLSGVGASLNFRKEDTRDMNRDEQRFFDPHCSAQNDKGDLIERS
jgi:hypothetical protein